MSIENEIDRLRTAKTNMKYSIEKNGISIPINETLDNYSNYIDEFQSKFIEKTLTKCIVPNGVTKIGEYAFFGQTNLQEIILPNTVTEIMNNSFVGCSALTNLNISSSVKKIGSSAFISCNNLKQLIIPDGVLEIQANAFQGCTSLKDVIMGKKVESLGSGAFRFCSNMQIFDFTKHISIPILLSTDVFQGTPSNCKIIVPDNLYENWLVSTNWSTYANKIIKQSDYTNF